jgi:hypothetical protein
VVQIPAQWFSWASVLQMAKQLPCSFNPVFQWPRAKAAACLCRYFMENHEASALEVELYKNLSGLGHELVKRKFTPICL